MVRCQLSFAVLAVRVQVPNLLSNIVTEQVKRPWVNDKCGWTGKNAELTNTSWKD